MIALSHLQGNARQCLADVPGLTLDGIAQYMDGDSRIASHGGSGFEGHLRRGNRERAGTREPRIAWLHGFSAPTLEQLEHCLR